MNKSLLLFLSVLILNLPNVNAQNYWERLSNFDDWGIDDIAVSPSQTIFAIEFDANDPDGLLWRSEEPPNWVLRGPATPSTVEIFKNAGVNFGNILVGTADGIYLSSDDGISFSNVAPDVWPVDQIFIDQADNLFVIANGSEVWFSAAPGFIWEEKTLNLSGAVITSITRMGVNDILVSMGFPFEPDNRIYKYSAGPPEEWQFVGVLPQDADINKLFTSSGGGLYALSDQGLFESPTAGATWTKINELGDFNMTDMVERMGDLYVCSPVKGIASDKSGNWAWLSTNLLTTGIIALEVDQFNNLYAGGDGAYMSDDGGDTWTFIGLSPLFTSALAVNSSNQILMGTSGAGLFRVTGNFFEKISSGLNHGYIFSIAINDLNNNFYVGTNGGIYRSTNNGDLWEQPDSALQGNQVRALVINSNGDFFAGTFGNGVYRSVGNDSSWNQVNSGLSNTFVTSLAFNPGNNILFAGTDANGLYYSTNNGDNWQPTGLINKKVWSISFNSDNDVFAGTQTGLFLLPANGSDWNTVDTLFTSSPVLTTVVNDNDFVFIGTASAGAFYSTDNGDNWIEINSGLDFNQFPVRLVTSYAIDSNGFIYAGTGGAGLFKSVNTTTDIESEISGLPAGFKLYQNYPNPFNPGTRIKYTIGSRQFTNLKVYDILGNEIVTLVNEIKPAGTYEVLFNAEGLPSGVYFYKLTAGSYSETGRMVLIK